MSISTALMLGLLFISAKSKNNKANIFLGLFLLSLGVEILFSFLDAQKITLNYTFETETITLVFLLFYVLKTLNKHISPVYFLLFIPFVLSVFGYYSYSIIYIFNIGILLYILRLLHVNNLHIVNYYSHTQNKTLSWIKTIVYCFLFFHLLWIVEDIAVQYLDGHAFYFAFVSLLLTFLMIYWIGYHGFSQPEIFGATKPYLVKENDILNTNHTAKPKKEQHDEKLVDNSEELFNQLSKKIKNKELYKQDDLTLRNLAHQLNINEHELSKLINHYTKNNFYHYINQFKIEEFKRLIHTQKAQQLSLLGLAEESGFSSKSTFYDVFKKQEGLTPKQYKDQFNKSD